MKQFIKDNLIFLPRWFRILWGRIFIYMLGKFGDNKEWYGDINLILELDKWIKNQNEKEIR